MGHYELRHTDAKALAERCAVGFDVGRVVATISIDIKSGVIALAASTFSGGAEGNHAVSHIVIVPLGQIILHLRIQNLQGRQHPQGRRRRGR